MFQARLKECSLRVDQTFKALEGSVVGRAPIIRQLKYAVVTGQHLLLEGPPGVAKSFLVLQLFKALTGCRTFKVQCTKKMTEDYIVGPLDMRLFREEGLFVHRTEKMLPDAHFGFIDEIMDLSSGALRALLEILNERTFTRGIQHVKAPLHSAIATTNFNRDEETELEAVLDRFMFRAIVKPLTRAEDKRKMLLATEADIPALCWKDIRTLNRAMRKVVVPRSVIDTYLDVCAGLKITDRTLKRALDVVRANAVLSGRSRACIEDITALDTCFVITNDHTSEQTFGSATQSYTLALETRQKKSALVILANRVSFLERKADSAENYSDIQSIAVEAREALNALNHFRCAGSENIYAGPKEVCTHILAKADSLYAEENA